MTRFRTSALALLAGALLAACGGADAPERAEPAEGIAPAPYDSTFVPGGGEPGRQTTDAEETPG